MNDEQYQNELNLLRSDWGGLVVDASSPGVLRALNDPTTGLLVGARAALIAEIINRALGSTPSPTGEL